LNRGKNWELHVQFTNPSPVSAGGIGEMEGASAVKEAFSCIRRRYGRNGIRTVAVAWFSYFVVEEIYSTCGRPELSMMLPDMDVTAAAGPLPS
jgi:hypothetical protein